MEALFSNFKILIPKKKIVKFFNFTGVFGLQKWTQKDSTKNAITTGNRKTWARIPAQSKASFFPQKDFQIL